jgi:ABC-type phosphate transport system substrate-binding protein
VNWADAHPDSHSANAASFANLVFNVDQTAHLGHQGITVSWEGGLPTTPSEYGANFIQIMQCWGDIAEPTPDQCQWGAPSTTLQNLVGSGVATRSVSVTDPAFDPATNQALHVPGQAESSFAYPFTSVNGESTWNYLSVFDSTTTNEVTAARTGLDGTGSVTFEVQTSLDAPHLGCGGEATQSDGSTFPRACWLVIVPRGSIDPDGTDSSTSIPPRITQSPFSPSVWQDRVVIPLNFEPVSQSCPIGQSEQRVLGSEIISDAFTSWQPGLCASGTTYGFSMIGDSEARTQIVSTVTGSSRLAFVSSPLSEEQSAGTKIVYAPVARSAIVFAYNIDYNVTADAPDEVFSKNGTRLHNLVFNQRIVAKLLTQSYRADNPGFGAGDSVIQGNPNSIVDDPEFVALNPDFVAWNSAAPQGLLTALGSSDAYADVWKWIRSSPSAVSFLGGTPDDWGMRINPEYLALNLGTGDVPDSFPKADLSTFVSTDDPAEPGYGSLDMRPYYNDMQETAYRTLRADGNVKTNWDPYKNPPGYRALPAQEPGSRMMISITTASAAARYGLDVARITNVNGDKVSPSDDAIAAAIAHFTPSNVAGVKIANPSGQEADIYPLAELVYAAINVCSLDSTSAMAYRTLLNYSSTDGQVQGSARGMLPVGYVPISADEANASSALATSLGSLSRLKKGCTLTTSKSDSSVTSSGSIPDVAPAPSPSSTTSGPQTGPTVDHLSWVTSIAGAGFLAGIPMCVAGPLMVRRARNLRDKL